MYLLACLHETASAQPDKLAVVNNGVALSYGRFWRLICACRDHLAARVPASGLALIRASDRLEGWILVSALRSLGLDTAVIVAADQLPLLESLGPAVFVTLATEPAGFAPKRVPHLRLLAPSTLPIDESQPLPPMPAPEHPGAHVLLTSGTTGRYKAVKSEGSGTESDVARRRASYVDLGEDFRQLGPDSVVSVLDLGLWTAAGNSWPRFAWCCGGAVLFQATSQLAGAFDWPSLTHSVVTPWHLSKLAAAPEGALRHRPDVQLVVVSGAVTPWLARQTMQRLTSRLLINLSSTEAGGWARTAVRSEEDLRWYRLDPKATVEVIDDAGNPLPNGELGRVRVKLRPNRVTSYLADPENTAIFFSDGWFYPGDLGVLDGKGRLALHGRTTDVVNIGGDKQAVGPWETAIQEKLGCEGVAIVAGRIGEGAEQLHVFIESSRTITRKALDDALRSTLRGFPEVQAHRIDALPRTELGKLRRVELARRLFEAGAAAPES